MADFSKNEPLRGQLKTSAGGQQSAGPAGLLEPMGGAALAQSLELSQNTPQAAAPSYTVASGDTLSRIAGRQLGSAGRWREIYELNRAQIGPNPSMIRVGQRLALPSVAGPESSGAQTAAQPETTQTAAQPETTQTAAQPETTQTAAQPETTQTAAQPETTQTAAQPETTQTAAQPETTQSVERIRITSQPETTQSVEATQTSTQPEAAQTSTQPEELSSREPSFPYVILSSGDTAVTERARLQSVFTRWGQGPFDGAAVSTFSFEPGEQSTVLRWQASWGDRPTNIDVQGNLMPIEAKLAVQAMRSSSGWAQIEGAEADQLLVLVGGETNPYSRLVRMRMLPLISNAGWASKAAESQAADLRGLLGSDAKPYLAEGPTDQVQPAPYTLTGPTLVKKHAFRGVKADADRYEVEVEGKKVPIFAPHAPDAAHGQFHSAQEAAIAFALMAKPNREVVNTITLNPTQNPDDAHWAVEYDTPNFRSYMTAGSAGDITIYPTEGATPSQHSMAGSLTHETGHTWSKRTFGESTSAKGWKPWLQAMADDKLSVSKYADNSPDEDAAETVEAYGSTRGTPAHDEYRAIVPARFKILDKYF